MLNITKLIMTLQKINGIGNMSILNALRKIKNPSQIKPSFDFLTQLNSRILTKKITNHTLSRDNWNKLLKITDNQLDKARQLHIKVVNCLDGNYPNNLKQVATHRFPVLLYVKGNLNVLNQKSVALVGTRKLSNFGKTLTRKYAKYAVEHGFATVAGLAYGTDAVGEWETVKDGGHAIAILANGLDQPIYPKPNTNLAYQIIKTGGALVSPYPLGSQLSRYTFVDRDKWQSGMSNGTIAVETGMHGGTNHTMQFTRKQGHLLGVPNYAKYFKTTNLPNQSYGTQYDINHHLAKSLYSRGDVKKFFEQLS